MASRRSLAMLLGIRGRAAVRWQESVSGVDGRMIAIGKRYEGRVTRTFDEEDLAVEGAVEGADGGSVASSASTQEAAASSWSALLERRNRQPVTIGLGLCVLAAFSGSNTVIYYASSVLKEAGVDDPNVLTYAVGVPNLLGGLIALAATDSYGRRPLLLLSFGGMTACLAALSVAAALTSGGGARTARPTWRVSAPRRTSSTPGSAGPADPARRVGSSRPRRRAGCRASRATSWRRFAATCPSPRFRAPVRPGVARASANRRAGDDSGVHAPLLAGRGAGAVAAV